MFDDYVTNTEFIKELGNRFKRYRKAIGFTQQGVSDKTGISKFTISEFENGRGSGLSLLNLCKLLECIECRENITDVIPDIPQVNLAKEWKRLNSRKNGQ